MAARGVFFDLYGTLLVYGDMELAWQAWREALLGVLVAHGFAGDVAAVEAACEGFFQRPLGPAPTPAMTVYERRLARLYRELGVAADPRRLVAATRATIPAWQQHVTLDPTAGEVLTALARSARLALVTNFDHPPHIRRVLRATGLECFFEQVVVSAEVGIEKPDPAIFEAPLAALGLAPASVWFVGDDAVDVLAAVGAGLAPVRIARDGHPPLDPQLPPHRVVRGLPELLHLPGLQPSGV